MVRAWSAVACWIMVSACDTSSSSSDASTKCASSGDKVGMVSWGGYKVAPGQSIEVASSSIVCNGQCPVTGHEWTVTPSAKASGTFTVTYGSHCGASTSGPLSSDQIGSCKLTFTGTTPVTSASLAQSHDSDCVGLWAGVNPTNPADTKPCSEGSPNNFEPYVTFFNNGTVDVTISGPGPANNPTAYCTYVP